MESGIDLEISWIGQGTTLIYSSVLGRKKGINMKTDKKISNYLERGQKLFDMKRQMANHEFSTYDFEAIEIAKMIQEEELTEKMSKIMRYKS